MIFGWDISTSIVGATALKDDGTYITSGHCDLRKVDGIFNKAQAVQDFVHYFTTLGNKEECVHYVEEKLGNFAMGRSMMQTLMTLASFNLVVSWFLWKLSKNVVHIHPSTVKAIMKKEGLIIPKGADKKELTLSFVSKIEPTFVVDKNRNDNPQPWCYDRADSYIVARAGYLRSYVSRHAQATEADGAAAGARP